MMGFDADDLALVRRSLRHVIDTHPAADVPAALSAEGWTDLVATDPASSISALCEEAGAARASAPALDVAMLWGAGLEMDAGTVVVVDGLVLDGAARAERFVHVTDDSIVSRAADAIELEAAGGMDPSFGLCRVSSTDREGIVVGDAHAAAKSIAAGRRALASQLVGAADQMLLDTLTYVQQRHQYDRAIGSFQTVKHRLADVKVAATAARAAIVAAWDVADTDDSAMAAVAAKCLAGRAHQVASTHCFQVHGGIAFTAEHGFQQWVRRGFLLDLVLGGHEQLTSELGRALVAAGRVPRVPNLH